MLGDLGRPTIRWYLCRSFVFHTLYFQSQFQFILPTPTIYQIWDQLNTPLFPFSSLSSFFSVWLVSPSLLFLLAACPDVCLQMLIRGANAVGYTSYPDNGNCPTHCCLRLPLSIPLPSLDRLICIIVFLSASLSLSFFVYRLHSLFNALSLSNIICLLLSTVVTEFIRLAALNGMDVFRIFDCFNDIESMKVWSLSWHLSSCFLFSLGVFLFFSLKLSLS